MMENPKVFFSYGRADSEFVLKLAKDLRSAGVNLWIDQLDIAAGDRWDRAVEDALGAAPCLLVVLSPASVESNNVMDEVSLAFDERKKIVPVLARECTIPFRLRRLQHVDFTVDYDRGLEGVLKALNLQPRPAPETGRDDAGRAAAVVASRTEPARSRPQDISKDATSRKYVYAAVGAVVLAAAGGVSFVLVPRYLDHSKGPGTTGGRAETSVNAPVSPDTAPSANLALSPESRPIAKPLPVPDPVPSAKFLTDQNLNEAAPAKNLAGLNEAAKANSPPLPDAGVKAQFTLPPPPPPPAQPVNGVWDVTMRCRDGSEVNEYGALFAGGTYSRTYKVEQGSIYSQLALGYSSNNTIRLTGSVTFEPSVVWTVDATGKKQGSTFVGQGTVGQNKNCKLVITNKN